MFSRFDTVPACVTDRQTDRRTSSLYLLRASACIADARKNDVRVKLICAYNIIMYHANNATMSKKVGKTI